MKELKVGDRVKVVATLDGEPSFDSQVGEVGTITSVTGSQGRYPYVVEFDNTVVNGVFHRGELVRMVKKKPKKQLYTWYATDGDKPFGEGFFVIGDLRKSHRKDFKKMYVLELVEKVNLEKK